MAIAERRKTRQFMVVPGWAGQFPVSVQSMTTTLTSDVNATLRQIADEILAEQVTAGPEGMEVRGAPEVVTY